MLGPKLKLVVCYLTSADVLQYCGQVITRNSRGGVDTVFLEKSSKVSIQHFVNC